MSKPRPLLAISSPIPPKPRMPKVLPLTSDPSQNMGWWEIFQLPSRTHLSLSTTRRATANNKAKARSAVDLANTPGV